MSVYDLITGCNLFHPQHVSYHLVCGYCIDKQTSRNPAPEQEENKRDYKFYKTKLPNYFKHIHVANFHIHNVLKKGCIKAN